MVDIAVQPRPTRRLVCVCVTTSLPRSDLDRFVGLPVNDQVGLTKPSWAAMDWLQELDADDVSSVVGSLPRRLIQFIIDGVEGM